MVRRKMKSEKRKPGRPRLPEGEAKTEALRFRLTPSEKECLVELARKAGTSWALLARNFVMQKIAEVESAT